MYVRTGARAEREEAADLGEAHGLARAVSLVAPPASEREGAPQAGATFVQRHWWLWPVMVIVCGVVAGALGLTEFAHVDGR